MSRGRKPPPRAKGFRPSDDKQRGILEHVRYERNMLIGMAYFLDQHLLTDSSSNEERALHDALLEAFLLHARNLRDFLFLSQNDNATEDDVLARDFFVDPAQWHRDRKTSPHLQSGTGGLNDQAGKYLAHLSYERVGGRPEPPEWKYAAIASAITTALETWERLAKVEQPDLDWAFYDT